MTKQNRLKPTFRPDISTVSSIPEYFFHFWIIFESKNTMVRESHSSFTVGFYGSLKIRSWILFPFPMQVTLIKINFCSTVTVSTCNTRARCIYNTKKDNLSLFPSSITEWNKLDIDNRGTFKTMLKMYYVAFCVIYFLITCKNYPVPDNS